jgi:hypothetical protein
MAGAVDEVRNALDAIIAERGEEMSELQVGDGEEPHYVAGGSTGFIVKDLKGKEADKPVYRIDSGVLQMVHALIEIGKHVAMELGQWTDRKRFFEVEDDDIVRPDLNKLTDEKMAEFTRLSKRRPQARRCSERLSACANFSLTLKGTRLPRRERQL